MKPITQWQSEDGRIFPTEKEALAQDALVALTKRLDDELWFYGISAADVAEWLIENDLIKGPRCKKK